MKNPSMPSWPIAGCLAWLSIALAAPVQAATITVNGSSCTLPDAITAANNDAATGGCAAGSGTDTLVLTTNGSYTLTGQLPNITSTITIEGNGSTITGNNGNFRMLAFGNNGNLTLDKVTVTGFKPSTRGGAITVATTANVLTVTNSRFSGNAVTGAAHGGAISVNGTNATVSISNSSLSGNAAGGGGGGINVEGSTATVSISNSTISGNTAGQHGGGLRVLLGSVTLSNSTVSGNVSSYDGGGLYVDVGTATVNNSTFVGNTAAPTLGGVGGGIYLESGAVTLRNSIVAGNTAIDCSEICGISAPPTGNANNLFGHAGETDFQAFNNYFVPGASDLRATSDGLNKTLASILNATLADNGGPTQTHALVSTSPAINASGANATTTDQRGYKPNTILGVIGLRDIGAYEFNGVDPNVPTVTAISPNTGPVNGGTVVTITGTKFVVGSSTVKFGANVATNVIVDSATQIKATSPAGTNTVDVTVTTNSTSATSAADQFTYTAANVNGACGSASGVSSSTAPASNLCATGTATAVSGSSTAWTWGCDGSGGGTRTAATACSAGYPKPTLTLSATASSIKVGASTNVTAQSDNGTAPVLSTSTPSVCGLGATQGTSIVTAPVSGNAAGTCTVAANQPAVPTGTSRYLAADEKTVNIAVSKKDQTIGTPSVSNSTIFVGATSTVSATASSGLTVSYSTSPSTVCTNSGGTVTGVGAGNCTVTISQAGDDAYNAASSQTASITVNAVPVNGACGSAAGSSSATVPSANLCSSGSANPVSGSNGAWRWTCMGQNGGTASNECSAPYASQTLSLSATPSSIEAGKTASILASSNSGLSVSLSASGTPANACTLSGTTVNGVNEGRCTVTANQAGTGDSGTQRYLAATSTSTTVTITKPSSACEAYRSRAGANVIDLRSSPGGQTVRGDASKFNVIFGSAFADTITGGNAGNCIDGGAGNDRLTAGTGENYLYGGDGNDTLTPGSGSTAMDGGAGTDKCGLASSRATATYASCESN
ncbi:beta strand repeat-containing protein [Stagnimonas aquatica]|uniref:beta strand repeat-containing protein n=1 Tax=Stagnimonas aquatica TaxID=2689987 RepID=UPI0013159710|nr:choice-of-anchor Q domain-containing protein [Stagnimonas aquatica]